MIETGLHEPFKLRFVERKAGSDEIDVEAGVTRGADEINDVGASQRFAAGEICLEYARLGGFAEDTGPHFAGEFAGASLQFERVGAIDAMERAAMS